MTICLLGASFDTCNMGVSALAESSIKVILNRWPNAEIILLGSGYEPQQYHLFLLNRKVCVRTIPIRFSKNVFLSYHFLWFVVYGLVVKVLPKSRFKHTLVNRNPYIRELFEADLVLDITGGDSFSDIYGFRRFFIEFLYKWLVTVLFGRKLILLPQTYGPFRRLLTKRMAKYIMKHASMIYSRDRAGVEYVKNLLGIQKAHGKVRFSPDVAFVLDSRRPSKINIGLLSDVRTDESVVVGLNISGLLYYGGYTRNNMFGLKEDYRRIICRIVETLMAKKGVLVLLIPHIFPPVELLEVDVVENDVFASLDIYKKYSTKYPARIFMACGSYDQGQVKYIIGLCDFFLGSRMHSCIAALSQKIPTVGLAYSKKFVGVFNSVGVVHSVIELMTATEDSVLDLVERTFSEREAIAQKLSHMVPKAQETVLQLF
ncbi:MAG: polysaccharide pyruvyl transferase family protein [Planctomycetota bacterium]